MKGYPLEELSDTDFEDLINVICQKILGTGTISFTKGKDGGKDGRFTGTAENYPSKNSPWGGKFIIQAKHTMNPNASTSDREFEKIVEEEIKKAKEIKEKEGLENYIIFTNRRQTGIKGDELVKKIKEEVGIINCDIIGMKALTTLLTLNKEVVDLFDLENLYNPLIIDSNDIAEVVELFHESRFSKDERSLENPLKHVKIELKNKINNLNEEYFKQLIQKRSQIYFNQIHKFLGDPKNSEYLAMYDLIAEDLQSKIVANREKFQEFNQFIEWYYDYISIRNPQLKKAKRLIRIFLHYMYWNCDIGKKEDD